MAKKENVKNFHSLIQAHVLTLAVTDTASLLKTVRVGELANEIPGEPTPHELAACADPITLMSEDHDPIDPRRYDNVRNQWIPADRDYNAVVQIINTEHQRLINAGLTDPHYDFRMVCARFLDDTQEELYPRTLKEQVLRSGDW
jgi:hypothetical protein